MNDHRYLSLEYETYSKFGSPGYAFIRQADMKRELLNVIKQYMTERGVLFLDNVVIATETLSPLAMEALVTLARSFGYHAACDNTSQTGRYLGSDGGGHYSTDYYEIIEYALVTIMP